MLTLQYCMWKVLADVEHWDWRVDVPDIVMLTCQYHTQKRHLPESKCALHGGMSLVTRCSTIASPDATNPSKYMCNHAASNLTDGNTAQKILSPSSHLFSR
eukprot:6026914-Amphidinium_carterae.1